MFPIKEAEYFQHLRAKERLTQREIAGLLGISGAKVSSRLALLKGRGVREKVRWREISPTAGQEYVRAKRRDAGGKKTTAVGKGEVPKERSSKGSQIWSEGELPEVPVVSVQLDGMIDTIGAGDAFDAGFLAAILAGWEAEKAAHVGTAVAAYSVKGPGGSLAVPEWRVEQLLKA